jgi:hypothetical protein
MLAGFSRLVIAPSAVATARISDGANSPADPPATTTYHASGEKPVTMTTQVVVWLAFPSGSVAFTTSFTESEAWLFEARLA